MTKKELLDELLSKQIPGFKVVDYTEQTRESFDGCNSVKQSVLITPDPLPLGYDSFYNLEVFINSDDDTLEYYNCGVGAEIEPEDQNYEGILELTETLFSQNPLLEEMKETMKSKYGEFPKMAPDPHEIH